MAIVRKSFYDSIRINLFGSLSGSQVRGMDAIIDTWEQRGLIDLRHLAYMLATVFHETAKTMQPIEEFGKGKGRPYGGFRKRSGVAYKTPAKLYFGRGLVQLTWLENYELMGRLLNIDLLNKPELALDLKVAIDIMFEGMLKASSSFGDFTGKCLEMYFNDKVNDPKGARKIINGTDKDALIAGYYAIFFVALN